MGFGKNLDWEIGLVSPPPLPPHFRTLEISDTNALNETKICPENEGCAEIKVYYIQLENMLAILLSLRFRQKCRTGYSSFG